MTPHAKRKSLNVPEWARREWESRPQDECAQLLMRVNFDKDWLSSIVQSFPTIFLEHGENNCVTMQLISLGDPWWEFQMFFPMQLQSWSVQSIQDKFLAELEIVVKKRSTQRMVIEEEWLSEKEMKDDYGWSTYLPSIYNLDWMPRRNIYIYHFLVWCNDLTTALSPSRRYSLSLQTCVNQDCLVYIHVWWFHFYLADRPRAKISGAVKACQAIGETHCRTLWCFEYKSHQPRHEYCLKNKTV